MYEFFSNEFLAGAKKARRNFYTSKRASDEEQRDEVDVHFSLKPFHVQLKNNLSNDIVWK
jgi:hypothetical protein